MSHHFQEPIHLSGQSMYPTLTEDDGLGVEFFDAPKPIKQMNPGEVVLLRSNNEWVAHRVVEKDGKIVSKGDWSNQFDNESSAWGLVTQVNGRDSQLLSSTKISALSQQIHSSKNRILRRYYRSYLWFKVKTIRALERIWR